MLKFRLLMALSISIFLLWSSGAYTENKGAASGAAPNYQSAKAIPDQDPAAMAKSGGAPVAAASSSTDSSLPSDKKPSHYYIQLQRYNIKNSGRKDNAISNVRLSVTFPNKSQTNLPENGQYWPIGNGQVQEINRTYELPAQYVQNDEFKFQIQMDNKGNPFLPCEFDVTQISQFNRAYVCSVDVGWQKAHGVKDEDLDEEAIQIRVFTDLNSDKKEIPPDAIALK